MLVSSLNVIGVLKVETKPFTVTQSREDFSDPTINRLGVVRDAAGVSARRLERDSSGTEV